MTRRQPKPLGTSIDVPEGAIVRRPDDTEVTVTGGLYVLDVPGVHVIDGREQPTEPTSAQGTTDAP